MKQSVCEPTMPLQGSVSSLCYTISRKGKGLLWKGGRGWVKSSENFQGKEYRKYEDINNMDSLYLISNGEGRVIWFRNKEESWEDKKIVRI